MAAPVVPHSFVLADLFDVAAMSYPVPDHVLEEEPGLEWVVCPNCDGEGWLEADSFAWETPRLRALRPELCRSIRPCPRCHGHREVLDICPLSLELDPLAELAMAA